MPPEYDPPNPRLAVPVKWRRAQDAEKGDIAEVWVENEARWNRQSAWSGDVLQGLQAGASYETLVDAVASRLPQISRKGATKIVRGYLLDLWRQGIVTMDFESPPSVFHDRYEVRRELGRGGVGVAWLCRDLKEEREVVVKHAWGYHQRHVTTDALMRREADIFAKLDHPGILRLHDTFERGGLIHLVREYAEGTKLLPDERLHGAELSSVALATGDILAHIHERGFLLLDMRPANFIRRGAAREPALIDVGLCKEHGGGEVAFDRVYGTPAFASPEMRLNQRATVRSDVWMFGRFLFYLAYGRTPLVDWDVAEMTRRLDAVGADAWVAPLVRALSPDEADERPRDMREALERCRLSARS